MTAMSRSFGIDFLVTPQRVYRERLTVVSLNARDEKNEVQTAPLRSAPLLKALVAAHAAVIAIHALAPLL